MDMAVASLFKPEIRLSFVRAIEQYPSDLPYKGNLFYNSPIIENVESVDASLYKPFVLYALSKILYEGVVFPKRAVSIRIGINDLRHYFDYSLMSFLFKPQLASPDVITFSFPDHLLNQPFRVTAIVECFFIKPDEYTPPIETYRQDCCVVCLESKPNILYFDCMHIAICDSCDRLKKTGRKNCDVCRAEISRKIKI